MLTLTYPAKWESNGQKVKEQLDSFLKNHFAKKYPGSYVWFLEFQERGAPHFHILSSVNLAPCVEKQYYNKKRGGWVSVWTNEKMQDTMQAAWWKIVGSDCPKHRRAGLMWERIEKTEGALRYAAKHAAKNDQKTVPVNYSDVGRFWGASRDVKACELGRMAATTEDVFEACRDDALSKTGKVRKYLWGYGPDGGKALSYDQDKKNDIDNHQSGGNGEVLGGRL